MTFKSIKSALLLSITLSTGAFAQSKYCGTGDSTQQELLKRPDIKYNLEQLESFTKDFVANAKHKRAADDRIIIPVVFHVMYYDDQDNISKEQVMSALETINTDYAKLNADTSETIDQFKGIAAKIGFEFRIATIDPFGKCTEGITRTYTKLANSGNEDVKDLVSWDTKKYLNVWIVRRIPGAGGYAFYPGGAPSPSHDGILIANNQFGSTGNTNPFCDLCIGSLTHEIGHYFNLRHTWGSSNTPGPQYPENCTDDDLVTDTPECAGAQGCSLYGDTACGPLANEQNYMDYSGCYTMFTEGQKSRMVAAAHSNIASRINLWSQSNLIATGTEDGHMAVCAPIADFGFDNTRFCNGGSVTFTDKSYNAIPTSYKWIFPGGTPSTSTDKNPTVTYNTEGVYDATLIAGSSAGLDTLTKKNIIIVRAPRAYYGMPFADSFESNNGTDAGWDVIDVNSDKTVWTKVKLGHTGTGSMKLDVLKASSTGTDELITPPLDFSKTSSPTLSFYTAYNNGSSGSNTDVLNISVSYTCGETWIQKYSISAKNLQNNPGASGSPYVPKSTDWKKQSYSLSFDTTKYVNVRFKFEYDKNGFVGNALYIDDVNFGGITGIDEEIRANLDLSVAPNPTNKDAIVYFNLSQASNVSMQLVDIVGRTVYNQPIQKFDSGSHQIPISSITEKGIYFVKLLVGDQQFTQKLIIN